MICEIVSNYLDGVFIDVGKVFNFLSDSKKWCKALSSVVERAARRVSPAVTMVDGLPPASSLSSKSNSRPAGSLC